MNAREIEWDESFEIGDSVIDSQHREMVQLANLVLCALQQGCENCKDDKRLFNETFKTLLRYTEKHFRDEERFMARHKIPGLEDMKRQHEMLAGELRRLWSIEHDSSMLETAKSLHDWIMGRLVPHFTRVDHNAFARFAFLDDDGMI
jgi:hemerythrin